MRQLGRLLLLVCCSLAYMTNADTNTASSTSYNILTTYKIGALTTTFTPPATCFSTTAYYYTQTDLGLSTTYNEAYLGVAATTYHVYPNIGTACYPPVMSPQNTSNSGTMTQESVHPATRSYTPNCFSRGVKAHTASAVLQDSTNTVKDV